MSVSFELLLFLKCGCNILSALMHTSSSSCKATNACLSHNPVARDSSARHATCDSDADLLTQTAREPVH